MKTIGVNDQSRQDLNGNWIWSLEEGARGVSPLISAWPFTSLP